jgi:hypothetical protein
MSQFYKSLGAKLILYLHIMSFKQNRLSNYRESAEKVIQVGGYNSNDTEGHVSKRQRTENGAWRIIFPNRVDVAVEARDLRVVKPVKMANSHLKGRKRFAADLADMKEGCKDGFYVQCPGMSARCAFVLYAIYYAL